MESIKELQEQYIQSLNEMEKQGFKDWLKKQDITNDTT